MMGDLSGGLLSEADHRRLHGQAVPKLFLLIIFPLHLYPPLQNTVLPVYIYLFDPILEWDTWASSLMGYLPLQPWQTHEGRDLLRRCHSISLGVLKVSDPCLPSRSLLCPSTAWQFSESLISARQPAFVKRFQLHHARPAPLEKMLATLPIWHWGSIDTRANPDSIADLLGGSVSVIQLLSLEISLTVVISFCVMMLLAKIPFLKKILYI